jgi:hypothetical protein
MTAAQGLTSACRRKGVKFRRTVVTVVLAGLAAACGGTPEPTTTIISEEPTSGPIGAVNVTRDVVADLEDRYADMDE